MKAYTQVGVIHLNDAGQISIKGVDGVGHFDMSKYIGQRLFIETEESVEEYRKTRNAAMKALLHYKRTWPKELTSGVMFFDGCRITYELFKEMGGT